MRKLKLLLPALFIYSLLSGQAGQINQVNIVSFTVKPVLPGTVDTWLSTPAALILVAQKVPNSVPLKEPRLVVQIRSGGAVICGNNMATSKIVDPFDVRTFSTADLIGLLANCRELKEGSYSICAQFFNIDKVPISREVCKEFRVEAPKSTEYAPPTLITPEDEKKFTELQLTGPVTFRWTPLVPKPNVPVTYRLKVWQLMQGQNATTAMRTNPPIVTKDVDNITQATISGIYTGPCRPPYLCDFIWNVQALTKDGKPLGNNNGNSEPYRFGMQEGPLKAPVNVLPENNAQYNPKELGLDKPINFRWTPVVPKPREPVTYRLKVWQLMQGQNPSTAMRTNKPIITKDVADITEATVSGIYTGPCRPPYLCDFVWNVQALDRAGNPVGDNEGTSDAWGFKITEENAKCPTNTFPEDNKKLTPEEAKKEMLFRWTPVVPKPQSAVTYRIKVWQLMQGQTGATAMRTNQPIVTKDVADITEASVSGIYTGPCRPPYLCVFVWTVETRNAAGQTSCTSEPTTFSVTEENAKCPTNTFPEDKKNFTTDQAKQSIAFRWTPVVPKPQSAVTYRIKVWQLMQGQNPAQAMRTNQPIVTKDVADITEASVSGIYTGPCRPPYLCVFVWTVETRNAAGQISCTSEPTTFSVTEESTKCPTNTFPEDKKNFTTDQAKQSIAFRWTPVVPKPQSAVTYRIKVWQLMQGQTGAQAMRTNQPIVTKDVADITEATVSSIYTGPCRPPYLCVYAWAVETRNAAGQTSCTSEPTTFSVTEEKQEIVKCPSNTLPEDKKNFSADEASRQPITFKWTKSETPGAPSAYRLKVWQLMQGQNAATAMRTNQPIVTKDVFNLNEILVSGIYTGPCRPPYLCDFVWVVEMRNAAGQTSCTSEPTTFSVKEEKLKCPSNLFPEDKKNFTTDQAKQSISFRWTPVVPKPQSAVTYRLKVWQLMQGQTGAQAMRTNQPIVTKDVADVTEASVNGFYTGPCRPPYLCDFVWVVEMRNAEGQTSCTGEPTTFSVKEEKIKCPTNLYPEDKKSFTAEQAKQPITFRWTPVVPKPQSAVTYRLKVWQLMQGQTGAQAMRTNPPIVTKDVDNITEATVSGIYTGPCRPPYLCDFVWAVETRNAAGETSCTSEPSMFFVTQYIIQLDSIKVSCTNKPGVYSFKYCITNPNPGTARLITLTVTSSVPAGATIGSFSPPLNTTIPPNGQLCITGTINAATNLSNICIGAAIQDVANNFWQAQKDTCVKVEPCKCEDCDEKYFKFNAPKPQPISYSNNILSFNQPITITTTPPKTIKSIKAELVYFEMVPENDLCIPCNKDAATYGHFANGTNSDLWVGPQNSLNINITTPQLTPCCSAVFRWCIRYKVEFKDCTTCNVLVCYEKKKDGCEKEGNPINNPKKP